jgi:hypothetical protein
MHAFRTALMDMCHNLLDIAYNKAVIMGFDIGVVIVVTTAFQKVLIFAFRSAVMTTLHSATRSSGKNKPPTFIDMAWAT